MSAEATSPNAKSQELPFSSLDVNSIQQLRDLKLAIEYKYLRQHSPGGVFLSKLTDITF